MCNSVAVTHSHSKKIRIKKIHVERRNTRCLNRLLHVYREDLASNTKIENSLVRKASVRPEQLSARLSVLGDVGRPSADEIFGHFPFVALVRELQGTRTIHSPFAS